MLRYFTHFYGDGGSRFPVQWTGGIPAGEEYRKHVQAFYFKRMIRMDDPSYNNGYAAMCNGC